MIALFTQGSSTFRRGNSGRRTAIGAAVLALAGVSSQAQEAPKAPAPGASAPAASADDSPQQTIVVTANRTRQFARDVPMAIDAISSKDLERYNLLDAKDIAKVAPGVELANNDGRQNVASLRGVSFNPDTGVSVAAVGTYINEVSVNASLAFSALYDLGQIEVLRGPQGTLRGQMTPAGAITMTTRRPDLTRLGGELMLTADNQRGNNLRGAFNVPIVDERLALRFAAVKDQNGANYVRNLTTGERSKSDTESYRLSLAWQATDELRFDLMGQRLDIDTRQTRQVVGSGVVTPFSLGRAEIALSAEDRAGVTDVPDRYRSKADLATLKAVWSIDDHHSLSFIGGYQDIRLDQGFDRDRGNVIPGTSIWQQVNTGIHTQSAELVFASEGRPFWNYTFGAYYEHTSARSGVDVASGAFLIDIPGGGDSRALFTRQSFKLSDSLTFDAGLRYSELTAERQSVASVPGFTFPPSVPDAYAKVVDKPVTWALSLTNRFSRDLTGYASMGHSFRPGTYQVAVLNPIDPSLLGMPPEKSDSFELGFKSDLFDRKASLNVTAFVQKYKGFIDYQPDTTYQYTNPFTGATQRDASPFNSSGDAQVVGLEAQLFARPTAAWDLNAGLSYVRSRYTSGRAPCNDSNGDGIPDGNGTPVIPAGQQVAFCPLKGSIAELPKLHGSISTEYRFLLDGIQPYVGALLALRPGFHSDKVSVDYAAFTNLNLFAGIRSAKGNWELGAFVKNALNKTVVTSTTTSNATTSAGAFGNFDSGYREVSVTAPRTVGLTGRYSF
jgi:iron complex outermembrane receptor protein